MEIKNYFAQDAQGNIMPSANCYLYLPGTTTLATGLVDGNGIPISNPFLASGMGQITFGAPNGVYDLRVTLGARDWTIKVQCADIVQAMDVMDSILGSHAENPTTRNNGQPLEPGDETWNSTDKQPYWWNGTAWVALNASVQALELALALPTGSSKSGFQQSGIGAAVRTSLEKLRDSVDIADYGNVGDGIADASDALQNCINEWGGKKRIVGSGKFRVTRSIKYHTSGNVAGLVLDFDQGSEIIGDFDGNIITFPEGEPVISLFGSGVLYQFQRRGAFRGLKITKSASATNIAGISTTGAWFYEVDRCNITGFDGHGISIPNRSDLDDNPDAWASPGWRLIDTDITDNFDGVHSQAGQGSASWEFNNCYTVNNKRHGYLLDASGHRILKGSCAYNGKSGVGSGIFYEKHLGVTPSNAHIEQVEIDSNRDIGVRADAIGFITIEKCRFISKNNIHNADAQLSHIKITQSAFGGLMRDNLHRIDSLDGSTVTLYDFGAANPNIAGIRVESYRVQNDTAESVIEASPGALAAAYGNTVVKAGAAGAKNSDYRKFVYKGEATAGSAFPVTLTTVVFKNTQLNTGWAAQHNSTTGVITIPYAGGYIIQGALTVSALASGARFQVHILRNGVAIEEAYFDAPAATARHTLHFFTADEFAVGDTIEIRASCGAGAANLMERTNCLLVMAI